MSATTLPHDDAVTDFADRVEAAEIPSLQQLVLFGSVAHAEHASDSDIDILAVIDTDANISVVEEKLRDLAYDVMLEHGAVFSIHGVSESTLDRRSDHPFFRRVLAEGDPIYG